MVMRWCETSADAYDVTAMTRDGDERDDSQGQNMPVLDLQHGTKNKHPRMYTSTLKAEGYMLP